MLDRQSGAQRPAPKVIRIHPEDNVAIVVDDRGLPEGAVIEDGLRLVERIPQAHKVALSLLRKGDAVRRYDTVIGYAAEDIPAGGWVKEDRLMMPEAPPLDDLPLATRKASLGPPLEGYT